MFKYKIMKMNKYLYILLFLASLFLSNGLSALPKDNSILAINTLMKNVEARYNANKTFQAKFKQIYVDRNFGKIESNGKVYFKRPGRMKWEYSKPSKKIIVSDGSNLWIYDRNDSQVILDKNFKEDKLPSSLAFLWGHKRLLEVFSYRLLSIEEIKGKKLYTVELIPKEDIANVTKIYFVINGNSFLIIETSLIDMFGNENRLIFQDQKLGKKIKDSLFKFKLPKGVQIVEPPKLKR